MSQESLIWKKRAELKKFFVEEYPDIHELQHINATQAGLHGSKMDITMQYDIFKALENLAIATTTEKYLLTQITSTIKQLEKLTIS